MSANSDDDTAAGAAFAFSPRFGGMLNMCGQRERELIREVRIGLVAFMRYTFGRQCRLLFAQSLYAEAAGRALAFLQQQGALIMQRQDNLARAWANDAPNPLAYGDDAGPSAEEMAEAEQNLQALERRHRTAMHRCAAWGFAACTHFVRQCTAHFASHCATGVTAEGGGPDPAAEESVVRLARPLGDLLVLARGYLQELGEEFDLCQALARPSARDEQAWPWEPGAGASASDVLAHGSGAAPAAAAAAAVEAAEGGGHGPRGGEGSGRDGSLEDDKDGAGQDGAGQGRAAAAAPPTSSSLVKSRGRGRQTSVAERRQRNARERQQWVEKVEQLDATIKGDALRGAMASGVQYRTLFLAITRAIASHYSVAKRHRFVSKFHCEWADILLHQRQLREALPLLHQQLCRFREDGWLEPRFAVLRKIARCEARLALPPAERAPVLFQLLDPRFEQLAQDATKLRRSGAVAPAEAGKKKDEGEGGEEQQEEEQQEEATAVAAAAGGEGIGDKGAVQFRAAVWSQLQGVLNLAAPGEASAAEQPIRMSLRPHIRARLEFNVQVPAAAAAAAAAAARGGGGGGALHGAEPSDSTVHLCPFGSVLHVRVLLRSSLPAPLHIDAVRLLLRDRDSVGERDRVMSYAEADSSLPAEGGSRPSLQSADGSECGADVGSVELVRSGPAFELPPAQSSSGDEQREDAVQLWLALPLQQDGRFVPFRLELLARGSPGIMFCAHDLSLQPCSRATVDAAATSGADGDASVRAAVFPRAASLVLLGSGMDHDDAADRVGGAILHVMPPCSAITLAASFSPGEILVGAPHELRLLLRSNTDGLDDAATCTVSVADHVSIEPAARPDDGEAADGGSDAFAVELCVAEQQGDAGEGEGAAAPAAEGARRVAVAIATVQKRHLGHVSEITFALPALEPCQSLHCSLRVRAREFVSSEHLDNASVSEDELSGHEDTALYDSSATTVAAHVAVSGYGRIVVAGGKFGSQLPPTSDTTVRCELSAHSKTVARLPFAVRHHVVPSQDGRRQYVQYSMRCIARRALAVLAVSVTGQRAGPGGGDSAADGAGAGLKVVKPVLPLELLHGQTSHFVVEVGSSDDMPTERRHHDRLLCCDIRFRPADGAGGTSALDMRTAPACLHTLSLSNYARFQPPVELRVRPACDLGSQTLFVGSMVKFVLDVTSATGGGDGADVAKHALTFAVNSTLSWLVAGCHSGSFALARGEARTFELSLLPVVSGYLPLPEAIVAYANGEGSVRSRTAERVFVAPQPEQCCVQMEPI